MEYLKRKKIIRILVYTLSLCVIVFAFLSFFFAMTFVSPHRVSIANSYDSAGCSFSRISFLSRDSLNLVGWYSKPDSSNFVMILLHGYSANRVEMLPRALMYKKLGFGVLLYDARACGESEGEHISLGYFEQRDLLGAMDFLKAKGIKQIGLDGFSQGGATILMASDKFENSSVKFVVLESTFSDLRTAIDNRYKKYIGIPGWLGGFLMIPMAEWILKANIDELNPELKIKNLKCPVLITSGSEDKLTKVEETKSIYENANEPKKCFIIDKAKHEDLYKFNPNLYKGNVIDFLRENEISALGN